MASPLQGRGPRQTFHAMLFRIVLLIITLSLAVGSSHDTCYWPDGSVSPDHHWCGPGAGDSVCCESGDACLYNGMCQRLHEGNLYRGSCLNQDYTESGCPNFCFHDHDTEVEMLWCGYDVYICRDAGLPDKSMTCNKSNPFMEFATVPGNLSTRTTVPGKPSRSSSTADKGAPLSATSMVPGDDDDTLLTATGTPIPPSTISIAVATVSASNGPPAKDLGSSSSASAAPTATPPPSSAVPIAIGASIGGIAVVSAVVTGVLFLRKRRRDAPARAETPPPAAAGPGSGRGDFDFGFGLDPPTTRIIDGHQRYPTIPRIDGRDATLYRGVHPVPPVPVVPPVEQLPRKEVVGYDGQPARVMSVELPG